MKILDDLGKLNRMNFSKQTLIMLHFQDFYFGTRVLISLVQSQLPSMQELLVAQLTLELLGGVRQLVIAQRVWPLELLSTDVALV